MHRGYLSCLFSLLLFAAGCRQAESPTDDDSAADTFTVMTYHLDGFGELDRDGDGIPTEPKPQEEVDALVSILLQTQPDVLCLQGMGTAADFERFQTLLRKGGRTFPFSVFLHTPDSPLNLALLSQFPLTETVLHTNEVYSMIEAQVPVTHGYLEVEVSVNPAYSFTLFNADLKSRDYHPLGQTEMRRNEARMLGNHVRRALREPNHPNVLAVGTFHDRIQSAALRAVTGNDQEHLQNSDITDPSGDNWTWYDNEEEVYRQSDYVLISSSMKSELLRDQSYILRSDEARLASGHRPIVAVFTTENIASGEPDAHHP